MTLHTRDDLRRALTAKIIEPLYLLYGAEDFLRDRAARAITDAGLAGAAAPAFNEATYNLNATDVQAVIAAAEQLPMKSYGAGAGFAFRRKRKARTRWLTA